MIEPAATIARRRRSVRMRRGFISTILFMVTIMASSVIVDATAIDLPRKAPLPSAAERDEAPSDAPEAVPLPKPRPAPTENSDHKKSTGPVGRANEAEPTTGPDERGSSGKPGELTAEEKACRQRLVSLGVAFKEHPPESDPAGCEIRHPIVIMSLGRSIGIEPEAELNCAMAEAAARFMADVVSPAAEKSFGQKLKAVNHASAYICRPRNGTKKLSEHAFGNALDIARFTLADGKPVDVLPAPAGREARFLAEIRKAACGPFKTVLGPGSDPDHALHFHFDLAQRRNGGAFCQ